ncbi:MAG: DUF2339 domain-containing protein [candidate division Zixibacteria bacterium]|nr:DUF2339 domain-containing protein [candidate division Zixibacteria bacterium]
MNEASSADQEERLRNIEERLAALEARQPQPRLIPPAPRPLSPPIMQPRVEVPATTPQTIEKEESGSPVTTVLGWGGVAALVLATAYMIRLAIENGWLTPARQVAIDGAFGLGLIVAGIAIRKSYRWYGSLLPAGGIVVLFLTVYGAHLYHRIVGPWPAAAGILLICLGALALREFYKNDLFTFFAVVGSFTGPLLLHLLATRPADLVIYFGAWDLVFCAYAFRARSRAIYLVSAYLAFVVFDATWRMGGLTDWTWAFGFQTVQLLLYASATALFSIRRRTPLREGEGAAHLPVLLFYYATQYALLHQHVPGWAPWIATASIVPLGLVYAVARRRLGVDARSGEFIVTAYAAVVLFHAVYMELVPKEWEGLVSLLAGGAILTVLLVQSAWIQRFWPLTLAFAVAILQGYGRLVSGIHLEQIVAWQPLVILHALAFYLAYALFRKRTREPILAGAPLYLGHLGAIAGAVHQFDSRLAISVVWGLLAVATLIWSTRIRDRTLGQSALVVFAAFAVKVLLLDLSESSSLVRIGCLVVLGVTLYVGGLLYQRIEGRSEAKHAR